MLVAVVGPGGDPGADIIAAAEAVGRLVGAAGHTLVTGGLDGVMAAASRGAKSSGAQVLALLPGDDTSAANAFADHVVATGMGQARNVLVVRSADAVIAVGGSWGTLSEVALAKRLDRPVVWLLGWQVVGPLDGVATAHTPHEAVATVLGSP